MENRDKSMEYSLVKIIPKKRKKFEFLEWSIRAINYYFNKCNGVI